MGNLGVSEKGGEMADASADVGGVDLYMNLNIPFKSDDEGVSCVDSRVKNPSSGGDFSERDHGSNGEITTNGVDGLTQEAKHDDDDDALDDNSKIVGDDGSGGKSLSTPTPTPTRRRGRPSKAEASVRHNSDGRRVADVLGSVSHRTRSRAVTGKKEEVKDVSVVENGSELVDGDGSDPGFLAGDFVWGKIKSHPWWPGRIYDPSNASEYALKFKHEGRLLVAYFGDGTFAWCDPSQLIPFEENFEEMAEQGSSKSFLNSLDEAVDEFGTLVELQMACSCARRGRRSSLPLVVNAGIKEEVHVLLNGFEKFSAAQLEPTVLLANIRSYARTVSVTNILELSVMKHQLSAFYEVKGGYSLPIYCEPVRIEGLVDNDGVPEEGSARGPVEGDWYVNAADIPSTQTGLEMPDHKPHKGRKEKSIAELLGLATWIELGEDHVNSTEGEAQSGVAPSSGKRKQKIAKEDGQTRVYEEEGRSGKVEPKSGRKRRKTVDDNRNLVSENAMITRSSARKKGGTTKSTNGKKKVSADKEDVHVEKEEKKTERLPTERKMSISVGIDKGSIAEAGYDRISPREKKKSKYLSPPFMTPLPVHRSSTLQTRPGTGGLEFSDVAKMGERMTKAANKLVGSPPIVKCSGETFQKSSKGSVSLHDKLRHPDHQTGKADLRSEVDASPKGIGSSNMVLNNIRSTALDPLNPRKDQSLDTIRGFLSSYRSANFKNGSYYASYKKRIGERKRKRERNSSDTKHGKDEKVVDQADQRTSEPDPRKRSTPKKKGVKSDTKTDDGLASESTSSAALLLTFPAEFTLPSKEDLVKLYSKFGLLDESKTELAPNSSTAKVVFVNSSDAEAAVDNMQKSSPFRSAKVRYEIQRLTGGAPEWKKYGDENRSKSSDDHGGKPSYGHESVPLENEPLTTVFIKQKLAAMNSMLAQTDGKMSEEVKSNLENEAKDLLKKVKMMTAASSSS